MLCLRTWKCRFSGGILEVKVTRPQQRNFTRPQAVPIGDEEDRLVPLVVLSSWKSRPASSWLRNLIVSVFGGPWPLVVSAGSLCSKHVF